MANEIKILVRTTNASKAGFEEVGKDVDGYAKKFSESFSEKFSENLSQNITQSVGRQLDQINVKTQASAQRAGDQIGNTIGERISERITTKVSERLRDSRGRFISANGASGGDGGRGGKGGDAGDERVHVDVDVDKQSLLSRLFGAGKEGGESFMDGFGDSFKTGITSIFSGDVISTAIKGALLVVAGGSLATVIAAALTSAILLALGGGALGVGIAAAFQNPRIKTALSGIGDILKKMFADFGANFLGPLENFLTGGGNGGGGGLIGVLNQVQPIIESIGKAFGPVAQQLGDGIIGFLQNALPGILRAVDASAPIIQTLADELPGIGDALSDFFDSISDGSPAATIFFKDFLNLIQTIIRYLGRLIEGFTKMYLVFRTGFLNLTVMAADWAGAFVEMARVALGWIPGLGPKFDHAAEVIKNFKDKANRTLNQIHDVDVTVRIRQVWTQVGQAIGDFARYIKTHASGGVTGAASGGPRGGMTWVGENGPELVDLAPGSTVHTAGDSRRMAAGGGQGGTLAIRLEADRTTEAGLVDQLFHAFRLRIVDQFGGDVQMALGRD